MGAFSTMESGGALPANERLILPKTGRERSDHGRSAHRPDARRQIRRYRTLRTGHEGDEPLGDRWLKRTPLPPELAQGRVQ